MSSLPSIDLRGAFFVLAQIGALVGALWLFRRSRDDRRWLVDLATGFGAVAGALSLVLVLRLPSVIAGEATLFAGSIAMAQGALAGAALGAYIASGRLGLPVARTLDALAPALGVMVVAGRSGCFIAGCCYGRPVAWGVVFPSGMPVHVDHVRRGVVHAAALSSHPVHPVQLYEVLVGMAMIAGGFLLMRSRIRGRAFAVVAAIYAVGRFAVEMFRGDPRPMSGDLSVPQWLSILILAAIGVWASRTT